VVPSDYDSLLAKVIAHGRDRDEARTRLVRAVAATRLAGVADNAAWLGRALRTDAFRGRRRDDALPRRAERCTRSAGRRA
jgi:3-methylcrotonyl-CoA carboxylase alpha subunit